LVVVVVVVVVVPASLAWPSTLECDGVILTPLCGRQFLKSPRRVQDPRLLTQHPPLVRLHWMPASFKTASRVLRPSASVTANRRLVIPLR
jgi:hypothetical protein